MLSLPLSLTDGRADCCFWLACWASGSGWISETVVVGDVGDVRVIVVVVVELWVGSRLSDGIPWFRISGAYCKKIDSHILPRACFNLLGCLLIDICRFFLQLLQVQTLYLSSLLFTSCFVSQIFTALTFEHCSRLSRHFCHPLGWHRHSWSPLSSGQTTHNLEPIMRCILKQSKRFIVGV